MSLFPISNVVRIHNLFVNMSQKLNFQPYFSRLTTAMSPYRVPVFYKKY